MIAFLAVVIFGAVLCAGFIALGHPITGVILLAMSFVVGMAAAE